MMQAHLVATYEAVQTACMQTWAMNLAPVASTYHSAPFQSLPIAPNLPTTTSSIQPPLFTPSPIPIPFHPPFPTYHANTVTSRDRRGNLILDNGFGMQTGHHLVNIAKPSRMAPPNPSRLIPAVSGSDGWKQIVQDWEHPDPSRALEVALKDWDPSWYSGSRAASRHTGSLYGQRRLIATEFIET